MEVLFYSFGLLLYRLIWANQDHADGTFWSVITDLSVVISIYCVLVLLELPCTVCP